jgi:hypothetical protein
VTDILVQPPGIVAAGFFTLSLSHARCNLSVLMAADDETRVKLVQTVGNFSAIQISCSHMSA